MEVLTRMEAFTRQRAWMRSWLTGCTHGGVYPAARMDALLADGLHAWRRLPGSAHGDIKRWK